MKRMRLPAPKEGTWPFFIFVAVFPVITGLAVIWFGWTSSERDRKLTKQLEEAQLEIERAQIPKEPVSHVKVLVVSGATFRCDDLLISKDPPTFAPMVAIENTGDPVENVSLVVGFDAPLDSVRIAFPFDSFPVRLSESRRRAAVQIPILHRTQGPVWIQFFSVSMPHLSWNIDGEGANWTWNYSLSYSAAVDFFTGIENLTGVICRENLSEDINPDTSDWANVPPTSRGRGDFWRPPPARE